MSLSLPPGVATSPAASVTATSAKPVEGIQGLVSPYRTSPVCTEVANEELMVATAEAVAAKALIWPATAIMAKSWLNIVASTTEAAQAVLVAAATAASAAVVTVAITTKMVSVIAIPIVDEVLMPIVAAKLKVTPLVIATAVANALLRMVTVLMVTTLPVKTVTLVMIAATVKEGVIISATTAMNEWLATHSVTPMILKLI
jgi:hypothetical protein